MKYADYYDCDICNGKSFGMSLFVQGCPIHCEGCFNPETWDFNHGKEWTQEVEQKFISLTEREYIKRISILGGSPLCDENYEDVYQLASKLKSKYKGSKQIWIFTGYTWEQILQHPKKKEILNQIDVLVDGAFHNNEKDLSLAFRGSKNQRVIDVPKSLETEKIVEFYKEGEDDD